MALTHYRNTATGQVYAAGDKTIPTAATLESRVREDGRPEYEKTSKPKPNGGGKVADQDGRGEAGGQDTDSQPPEGGVDGKGNEGGT